MVKQPAHLESETDETDQSKTELPDAENQIKARQPGKSVLVSLLIMNFFVLLLYTNVCVLVPMFILEQHPIFDSLSVGFLFASYQITFMIFAPFIGSYLAIFGRRKALFVCIITVSTASAIFAIGGKIQNDYLFYGVSLAARMIQGFGEAILVIVNPALISNLYPDRKSEY